MTHCSPKPTKTPRDCLKLNYSRVVFLGMSKWKLKNKKNPSY